MSKTTSRHYVSMCILLLWSLGASAAFADLSPRRQADIIFHITDFGINQWDERLETGQDFGVEKSEKRQVNMVHPELCDSGQEGCDAQILIVMPNIKDFKRLSAEELEHQITKTLIKKVRAARRNGTNEFEIQLVQNIDTVTYTSKERQRMVRQFGAAAYRAIARLHHNMSHVENLDVYTDATVGSNGTVVLTENAESWAGYLQAVDLFDGRASREATLETIRAVKRLTGTNQVRLFNVFGDWPAADEGMARFIGGLVSSAAILAPDTAVRSAAQWVIDLLGGTPKISIANLNVAEDILRREPDTKVYLLERLDLIDEPAYQRIRLGPYHWPGSAHVSGMNGRKMRDSPFNFSELVLNRHAQTASLTVPRRAFYRDIRDAELTTERPLTRREIDRLLTITEPQDRWVVALKELAGLNRTIGTPTTGRGALKKTEKVEANRTRVWLINRIPGLVADASPEDRWTATAGALACLEMAIAQPQTRVRASRDLGITRQEIMARFPEEARAYYLGGYAPKAQIGVNRRAPQQAHIGQVFLATRPQAENLAASVQTLGKAIKHLSLLDDGGNQMLEKVFGLGESGLLDRVDKTAKFYNLATAIEKDLEMGQEGQFVLLRLHTFEQLAHFGFEDILPIFYKQVLKTYRISGATHRFFGDSAPSLGTVEFLTAAARQVGAGRADVDTITLYIDGLNNLAWGALGLAVCQGSLNCASAYQSIGDTLAKVLRDASEPWFRNAWLRWTKQGRELEDAWRTLQQRNLNDGRAVVSIETVYGRELLKQNGITDDDIDRLNREGAALQELRIAMAKDLSPQKVETFREGKPELAGIAVHIPGGCRPLGSCAEPAAAPDVSGVYIDPKMRPGFPGAEGMQERVLRSRPSQDSVSWPLDIPEIEQ